MTSLFPGDKGLCIRLIKNKFAHILTLHKYYRSEAKCNYSRIGNNNFIRPIDFFF